jgi:lipoprotein-anchoring transpeptidase ErfK/SrfK
MIWFQQLFAVKLFEIRLQGRSPWVVIFLVLTIAAVWERSPAVAQSQELSRTAQSMGRSGAIATAMTDLKLSAERWIEIDLSDQRLFAWEGRTQVYAIKISTGKASTPTPTGVFAIQERYRSTRMQGQDYDVPNVPYAMFFYGGYAIHGAYWHHRFGTPVSHGCVNVAVDHAQWLYNWATLGVTVVVHH